MFETHKNITKALNPKIKDGNHYAQLVRNPLLSRISLSGNPLNSKEGNLIQIQFCGSPGLLYIEGIGIQHLLNARLEKALSNRDN